MQHDINFNMQISAKDPVMFLCCLGKLFKYLRDLAVSPDDHHVAAFLTSYHPILIQR